ncbi:MAG: hypothetical protein II275_03355 [Bacteroidaceae bacterium]|nr:hypothetical protein [Bacteroidaceae bacterium]
MILLITTIFTACTEHGEFERRLAVADSLMTHEQPDSAYRMLCGMDAEAEEVSEPLRMRHLLLRSNAQNKAYVDFTSDSIGCLLVDYYDAHGTPNERMLAHYIKGCAYRDMGDQPASLRCYNDAVAAADTSRADCNYEQLSIIYGQIARIFRHRAMPDNALQAYEYAERYAWKAKDTIKVFTFLGNKSDALIDQGKIQEALRIKEAAAKGFRTMGYSQYAAQIMGLCIKWYARQGEFGKAKAAMDDYENHSGYFLDNGEIEPGREDYYHIKGTYYLEKGQLDSAEHYFRKLKRDSKTANSQYLASWGLSQLFHKQGISDSVAKYAFIGDVLNDTLYSEQTALSLQNAQAMYNYDRHQEKALRKEMEAKEARIRFYQLTLGVVLLAILSVLLYRKYLRHKMRQLVRRTQNELTAHANTINQLKGQIQEKTTLIQSLNKQLGQNALDIKENEYLKQTITILEDKIKKDQDNINRLTSRGNLHSLVNKPLIARFIQMAQQRLDRPDKEMWDEICKEVEAHYPNIISLKQNKLINKSEYRLCILIKLGLKIPEIIYLENSSNANISNMRRRMCIKLGIDGGAKDFDRWLQEI